MSFLRISGIHEPSKVQLRLLGCVVLVMLSSKNVSLHELLLPVDSDRTGTPIFVTS